MSDYITDPELLSKLNESAPAKKEDLGEDYITDPTLLSQLNEGTGSTQAPEPSAVPAYYMSSPTGAAQLMGEFKQAGVFQPIVQSATQRAGAYMAKPAKAVIDAATMFATGIPGAAPMAAFDTLQAARESLPLAKQALNSMPNVSADTFMSLANKLKPNEIQELQQLVKTGGGKAGLTAFELPARLAADAEAVAALQALKAEAAAAPGMLSRLGMPVLRGVAKVAGPAALGYDVYEAGKFAQESELGRRLAQGEGQFAPQAARDVMLNRNVSGYQPTPQEAANLLASGDQRTIQIYGGAQRLANLAAQPQSQQYSAPSWIDNAMNTFRKYRTAIGQ